MSDTVWLALIAIIPATLSSVLSFLAARWSLQNAIAIKAVEKHTNSMKDALIQVTGEAEFAKGLKQGEENPK